MKQLLLLGLVGPLALGAAACAGPVVSSTPPPAVLAADSAVKAAIANERSIDAATLPQRSVSVTPFRVNSADTSLHVLGVGLADLLLTDLSRSRDLQVVDRLRVDALLRELGLARAGAVDTATAARFGRLVGARRLVLGTLTAGDDRARLDGRVGDVATGTLRATEATSTSIDAILDAEKTFALSVLAELGVTLTPAERQAFDQRPTRSLAALLAYSRGVRSELLLDYQAASAEYRNALRIDPRFANARSKLESVQAQIGAPPPSDLGRVAAMALEAVNASVPPQVTSAADPAFRQRLTTTIIILLNLP